ncbi:hypothetical protein [Paenibacillus ginsengihumi]|nr:hypothetical protein [Paenibacillus ginsengihumi]
MPYIHFSEIWTPLKLIGIRLYRDDDRGLWVKLWSLPRKRIWHRP